MKKNIISTLGIFALAFASIGQSIVSDQSLLDGPAVQMISLHQNILPSVDSNFNEMLLMVDYDLSITSTVTERYYSTPISQITPRTFESILELSQTQTVTNPTAHFEVFRGAISEFTNSQTIASLMAGSSVSMLSTSFTPSVVGDYKMIVNATAVETDPDLSNNSDSLFFSVNDSIFATSDGIYNMANGFGPGSGGVMGNVYSLVADDDLTSITFSLNNPSIGDTVVGVVYDMVGVDPNQIIATTDTLFITSSQAAVYTLPINGGAVTLVAGDYLMGIQETVAGSNISLAIDADYFTPENSKILFFGTWYNLEDLVTNGTYVVNANFSDACPTPIVAFTESITSSTVNFTDMTSGVDSWFWDFGDGTTSTVQNPSHTYSTDGTYNVCLVASNNCGSDTVCNSVTISTAGISENSVIDNLTLYPIPAQGVLTIANLIFGKDFKLELMNNLGQVVKMIQSHGLESVQMDLSNFVEGFYLLRISNSEMAGTRNVLIK